ncbi:MAG: cytochrome c3 family protein [Terriglobia bacterium]
MQLGTLKSRRTLILLGCLLVAILAIPGASLYYDYSGGVACARCHEIWQPYHDWNVSAHRSVSCQACHGDVFTLDAGFHLANMRRVVTHLRGNVPERPRLKNDLMFKVVERCQKCHQQEFADWKASRHSITYAQVFLDPAHNQKRLLMDDCLRCHGMHFEGSIKDLVTPIDTKGPWKFEDPKVADLPVIPCLSCHQMHREGPPLQHPLTKNAIPGAQQEFFRPSLGLFDRRELTHISAARLDLPSMRTGKRQVKISPDTRQAICYQCHAPLATFEVGSGDDRTAIGVHEGISCLACHQKHRQTTRASCMQCHPRMSNCGLDVERMDTTFKDPKSPHNIHFVKCLDCHPKGVRRRQRPSETATLPSRDFGGSAGGASR